MLGCNKFFINTLYIPTLNPRAIPCLRPGPARTGEQQASESEWAGRNPGRGGAGWPPTGPAGAALAAGISRRRLPGEVLTQASSASTGTKRLVRVRGTKS